MPVVTSGLNAEYLMREGSGTVVHDSSGNGQNGNFVMGFAPTWTTLGLTFSGSSAVQLPNTVLANDNTSIHDFTLEAWVNPVTPGGGQSFGDLFSFANSNLEAFQIYSGPGNPKFDLFANGDSGPIFGALGVWQQVVFVRNTTGILKIYVNGLLAGTHSTGNSSPMPLTGTKFLGTSDNSNDGFSGTWGEARVYTRELTVAEINQNYNARASVYSLSVPLDGQDQAGSQIGDPGDQYRNYGPISSNGALWTFPMESNDTVGIVPNPISSLICKSTDNGVTWSLQDQAHAVPQVFPSRPFWDGSANTFKFLSIAFSSGVDTHARTAVELCDFDMSTGLYGTPVGSADWHLPVPSGANSGSTVDRDDVRHAHVCVLSSGTVRVVYTRYFVDVFGSSGTQAQVYYRDFSGGSWSSANILPSQTVAWNILYDTSSVIQEGDVIHVLYNPIQPADIPLIPVVASGQQYVRILAGGTFSSVVTLDSVLTADGAANWQLNAGILADGQLVIPCCKPNVPTVGVLIGTPSTAPVFSYISAHSLSATLVLNDMKVIRTAANSLKLAWTQTSSITGNNSQIYSTLSTNLGASWSSPTLDLDLDATPLPLVNSTYFKQINTISLGPSFIGAFYLLTTWAAYPSGSASPPTPPNTATAPFSITIIGPGPVTNLTPVSGFWAIVNAYMDVRQGVN